MASSNPSVNPCVGLCRGACMERIRTRQTRSEPLDYDSSIKVKINLTTKSRAFVITPFPPQLTWKHLTLNCGDRPRVLNTEPPHTEHLEENRDPEQQDLNTDQSASSASSNEQGACGPPIQEHEPVEQPSLERAYEKPSQDENANEQASSKEAHEQASSKEAHEQASSKEAQEQASSKEAQEQASSKEAQEQASSKEAQEQASSKEAQEQASSKEAQEQASSKEQKEKASAKQREEKNIASFGVSVYQQDNVDYRPNRQQTKLLAQALEQYELQAPAREQARLLAEARQRAEMEAREREHARFLDEAYKRAELQARARREARLSAQALQRADLEAEAHEQAGLEADDESVGSEAEENESVGSEAEENESVGSEAEENESVGSEAEENESVGSEAEENESVGSEAEENESVGSEAEENESVGSEAEENESVGSEAEENESVGSEAEENESVGSEAEENESVGSENESIGSENESIGSENDSVGSENESGDSENELPEQARLIEQAREQVRLLAEHFQRAELEARAHEQARLEAEENESAESENESVELENLSPEQARLAEVDRQARLEFEAYGRAANVVMAPPEFGFEEEEEEEEEANEFPNLEDDSINELSNFEMSSFEESLEEANVDIQSDSLYESSTDISSSHSIQDDFVFEAPDARPHAQAVGRVRLYYRLTLHSGRRVYIRRRVWENDNPGPVFIMRERIRDRAALIRNSTPRQSPVDDLFYLDESEASNGSSDDEDTTSVVLDEEFNVSDISSIEDMGDIRQVEEADQNEMNAQATGYAYKNSQELPEMPESMSLNASQGAISKVIRKPVRRSLFGHENDEAVNTIGHTEHQASSSFLQDPVHRNTYFNSASEIRPPVHRNTYFNSASEIRSPVHRNTYFNSASEIRPPVHRNTYFNSASEIRPPVHRNTYFNSASEIRPPIPEQSQMLDEVLSDSFNIHEFMSSRESTRNSRVLTRLQPDNNPPQEIDPFDRPILSVRGPWKMAPILPYVSSPLVERSNLVDHQSVQMGTMIGGVTIGMRSNRLTANLEVPQPVSPENSIGLSLIRSFSRSPGGRRNPFLAASQGQAITEDEEEDFFPISYMDRIQPVESRNQMSTQNDVPPPATSHPQNPVEMPSYFGAECSVFQSLEFELAQERNLRQAAESQSESSHGNGMNALGLAVVGTMSPTHHFPPLHAADVSKRTAVPIQFGGQRQ
ncbi:neurofilament heavy polypeptide [Biomphalaria glabrata]|nr:neurofilament heavy polypeptide [Biomphalaria glabrata]